MKKYLSFIVLFCLCSCQTLEQLSIDYMVPADISFPPQIRNVAVVNNVSLTPENSVRIEEDKINPDERTTRKVAYHQGNASIATESLAQNLADQNYFDAVIICDSALRAKDHFPRESTLGLSEVNELAANLNADAIIALENLELKEVSETFFIPELSGYIGTTDVKIHPTVRVYLPNRSYPLVSITANDSVFWEEHNRVAKVINTEQMIREASEFAGFIPIRHIIPTWTTENRVYYINGSVDMRDAVVYVKENNWPEAYELWQRAFQSAKPKLQMRSAFNIALYYEISDQMDESEIWIRKAMELAKIIDKVDENQNTIPSVDDIPNYYLCMVYLGKIQKRKQDQTKLNLQMQRFDADL